MSGYSMLTANLPQQLPLESRSVTIVIPALNEEGNLERLLYLIEKAFLHLGFTLPVVVIDDGSTDESAKILVQLQQKYDFLTVITHPQRLGVTSVWKTAIANTSTDWILWGQADLESNPELDIPLLLEACTKEVNGVAGWRQNRGDGKKLASKVANTTCRLIFGLKIHDMNWIKLVPRELVAALPMDVVTHRYLLAVLSGLGYNIIEVPTPWFPRYSGYSKFGKKRLISSSLDFIRAFRWFISKRFSTTSFEAPSSEKENLAHPPNSPSQN
jgi:dolichol-phosphate mannosyltransferase